MKLPLYQIDAFSDRAFSGNPAAVVPLTRWLDDRQLLAIAAENNLSETAFMVADGDDSYALRWFTPVSEVDLCGHATLAAAWVHFHCLGGTGNRVRFSTVSAGVLGVARDADRLTLDFPSRPAQPCDMDPERVAQALGLDSRDILGLWQARDTLVEVADEALVLAATPNDAAIAALDTFAVCLTAPGTDCDFVSRFFAPQQGIAEDPVTGSAHCTLAPFWHQRLDKLTLHAKQLSRRGGTLWCTLANDRVMISGEAICVIEGTLLLPEGRWP